MVFKKQLPAKEKTIAQVSDTVSGRVLNKGIQ